VPSLLYVTLAMRNILSHHASHVNFFLKYFFNILLCVILYYMSNVKFTNYEGQKYEVKIRKPRKEIEAEGICYPPKDGGCAKILINPHQDDDNYNETLIHELSHAFFWGTDEEKITYFAKKLSQILKKLGR